MLKAIDLFSGSGGTTAGLKKSGIEVVGAVEIDAQAAETYRFNNPEISLMVDDIRNITTNDICKKFKIENEDTILLVACPPCQGFSSLRKGGEDDFRNELVFEYERIIKELRPEFLLMENVAGMSRGKGKKIFKKFTDDISKEYEIIYDILNAADYGVPQIRRRLVLHGIRKDIKKNNLKIELPQPTHSKYGDVKGTSKWVNASVILGLPSLKAGEEYKSNGIYNHFSNGISDLNIKRMIYIRNHGGSISSLPSSLQLNSHKNFSGYGDVYGILDMNKPSNTITGGCLSYTKGRFGHPKDNRALSAREAARLQSFDDDYVFKGSHASIAQQIGNAVPVLLARASGLYFLNLYTSVVRNEK